MQGLRQRLARRVGRSAGRTCWLVAWFGLWTVVAHPVGLTMVTVGVVVGLGAVESTVAGAVVDVLALSAVGLRRGAAAQWLWLWRRAALFRRRRPWFRGLSAQPVLELPDTAWWRIRGDGRLSVTVDELVDALGALAARRDDVTGAELCVLDEDQQRLAIAIRFDDGTSRPSGVGGRVIWSSDGPGSGPEPGPGPEADPEPEPEPQGGPEAGSAQASGAGLGSGSGSEGGGGLHPVHFDRPDEAAS